MKRAGMEQKKVANREGFLFRNLAAVLAAAAMMLLIPAAAQAGADDYYWDEQTVKEWQENSAQSSEKEEQGFEGYTEEVWSYCEKEPTESENPAGENETGGSHAVAPGFISEESLIETAPVVRSTGNLNTFNTEGVEVHPVPGEYPGLDDAPFDDKHDPDRFDPNQTQDPGSFDPNRTQDPSDFAPNHGFGPNIANPDPSNTSSGSGQGFGPFDPSNRGSGNNTGDSLEETEGPLWFGLDETVMSGGGSGDSNDTSLWEAAKRTAWNAARICAGTAATMTGLGAPAGAVLIKEAWDDQMGLFDEIVGGNNEEDTIVFEPMDLTDDGEDGEDTGAGEESPIAFEPMDLTDDGEDGEDTGADQEGPIVFEPMDLTGDDDDYDDSSDDSSSDDSSSSDDDEKDEKGCAIDPTMDGGGTSGQGSLVNGPPADYDPLTDGLHGLTPEYDPRLPNDGRRDIDGTIDPSKTPGYGLTPERDPRLPNDGCGDLGGKIDPSKAPGYGLTPERDPRLPDDGNTPDSPLSFSQGKAPVFPGSLFGKELELNAETVEK